MPLIMPLSYVLTNPSFAICVEGFVLCKRIILFAVRVNAFLSILRESIS
jgi:hypothetical protein